MRLSSLITAATTVWMASTASAAITFTPGHYYGTGRDSSTTKTPVRQYDAVGNVVGEFVPGLDNPRGLAFGPDELLYLVSRRTGELPFTVTAYDRTNAVVRTYTGDVPYSSNATYGGIAIDSTYLYTAGSNKVSRFRLDSPSTAPTTFFVGTSSQSVYDIVALANGNVLVADAISVNEVTPDGQTVRRIAGPLNNETFLSEIRSIAYDPKTDALYIGQYGTSSLSNRLLKLKYSTGQLLTRASIMAFDITLNTDGNLLLGAEGDTGPQLYSPDLTPITAFGGSQRMFVAQFVPEPGSLAALALGAIVLSRRQRRREPDSLGNAVR